MAAPLPMLSLVTPSYNQGEYIEATIRSVLDQGYAALDYLVVDGGSTDQTLQVLRRYEGRLRWVSEKDRGQSDAINKGLERTRGEIFAWLNSDDTYAPGAIATAVQYLQEHPEVDVVYGDADFIDQTGDFIRRCAHIEPFNQHRLLHYSDFIVQPAAFFRRSAFEAVGGVDVSLHYAMDYDLWLKLARQFRFAYLPRVLANYRWFGTNKTGIGGQVRLDEVAAVARRHGTAQMPAYFCLEQVALHLVQAMGAARRLKLAATTAAMRKAVRTLAGSPKAMESLLRRRTWNVIWTGQILRHHAAQMSARQAQKIEHRTSNTEH